MVEFAGLSEVGEVLVISEDKDRGGGSEEVMLPGIKGMRDTEEFSVIDVIILFGQPERL